MKYHQANFASEKSNDFDEEYYHKSKNKDTKVQFDITKSVNEWMYIKYLPFRKKKPYKKGRDFINGHYIIFSIFFCMVMFHEPQTWSPMVIEKL